MFVKNLFGHRCDVCDRLWFLLSLKPAKEKQLLLLNNTLLEFKLWGTFKKSLYLDKVTWVAGLDPIRVRPVTTAAIVSSGK